MTSRRFSYLIEQTLVTLESLAQEVKELRQEVEVYHRAARKLEVETETFKNANSSRRGLEGRPGERGIQGEPGRDARVEIKMSDGRIQIVENDQVRAEVVAVPGPAGKDAVPAKNGVDGRPGRDGKDAPSLDEIVSAVIAAVKSRL